METFFTINHLFVIPIHLVIFFLSVVCNCWPKDKIPADLQNNIVYKIPCKDCEATYIGESKRSFKQRSRL